MDVRDLLLALRRYWLVAAGVAVLILAIGSAAAFLPQKTYRSVVTIVMDFSPDAELSIQEVNFLLPALEERAQSQRLRDAAEGRVPDELQDPHPVIDATIDTSVLRIGATATRPRAAQEWANAAAEQLIEEREGVPPLALELLEPAPLRIKPVSPRVLPIMMATLVVALVAAVFAALAAERAVALYRQSFWRVEPEDDPDALDDRDEVRRDRAPTAVPADEDDDAADGDRGDGDRSESDGERDGDADRGDRGDRRDRDRDRDRDRGDRDRDRDRGDRKPVVVPGTVGTARHRSRTRSIDEQLVPEGTTDVAIQDEAPPGAASGWGLADRSEQLRALLVPMVVVGGLIVLAAVLTMALMLVRAL